MKQDMIVILDLGSEENPRLAREIRALGVCSELYPHDITLAELNALPNVKGGPRMRRSGKPSCPNLYSMPAVRSPTGTWRTSLQTRSS